MSSFPPGMVLIAGALVLPLAPRRWGGAAFVLVALLGLMVLFALEPGSATHLSFLDYDLVVSRVDGLSLAFGYVFAIMSVVGGVYALHLRDLGQQMAGLLYAGSALGVVFAGDLLTLVVFWEVMALASLYLILARGTRKAGRAGLRYLAWHLSGGSVLLMGVLWHLARTDSLAFNAMEWSGPAMLILVGFALNAAIPPLHAWLTDSYPEGTATGSVFLSAFTTKVAVYTLARGFPGWEALIFAGTAMALYGALFAVLENDIRRLLSYHIVSQVGYMVAGVGIGTEMAINGATSHAFAHVLYKGLLLMGTGAVLYTTGRTRLTELGGLAGTMPLVVLLYLVGAVSISGFPLFSGFVSKSMVVEAARQAHLAPVVFLLELAAVGTFLSIGLKLPYFTWFGERRGAPPARRVPRSMYVGMGLAAALSFGIGVYPAALYNLLPFPVDFRPYTAGHLTETIQLLLGTGLAFYLFRHWISPHKSVLRDTDWAFRRAARPAYVLAVLWPSYLFGRVDAGASRGAQLVGSWAGNPVGYLLAGGRHAGWGGPRSRPESGVPPFDPDRYRAPLGVALGAMVLVFIVFAAWMVLR